MKHKIAFRKNLICLSNGEQQQNTELAMSVVADLMQFGYMPTEAALRMLSYAPKTEVVDFHNEVIDYLREMTGGKGNFRPFWKNFPQDVMDKSESELLFHMLVNYWTNGAYEPSAFTRTRPTAYEQAKYTYFDAGTQQDFKNIFRQIVSVNQSLSPQDLEDVKWFLRNSAVLELPEKIPFKETLCVILGELSKLGVVVRFA